MSKVIIEIISKGLYVPNTVLTQWGWREGTEVIVEQPHVITFRFARGA